MIVTGKSTVKANNDVFENRKKRSNEDAMFISKNKQHIAIADGAGGVGIIADKWSQKLVNNIPTMPFKSVEGLDDWISTFWEDFYNSHLNTLKDDPWKLKKFEDEGSLATLSVIWHIGNNKFQYQSYGDSAMFVFNTKTEELTIQQNLQSINSFTSSPPLINWRTEQLPKEYFYTQTVELNNDTEIILATDGMAMYIHGAWMAYKNTVTERITDSKMQKIVDYYTANPISNFTDWLMELKASLKTKKAFAKLTKNWYKNKFLPNDDYTLVFVE